MDPLPGSPESVTDAEPRVVFEAAALGKNRFGCHAVKAPQS